MTVANDSVLVTPGSGATIATHLVNSKEHQVVMVANANGHLQDTLETWYFWSTFDAGAQNEVLIDIFNATGSGKVLKVRKLFIQHNFATVVGVGHQFDVFRTSSVGTGGTGLTARPADPGNPALPSQVTARHAATGGAATSGGVLFSIGTTPEETFPTVGLLPMINWIPEGPTIQEIVVPENQGLKVVQITNSTVGVWACLAVVTVE